MTVREAYLPYTDPTGMVSGTRNPAGPSGNCILETCKKLFVLRQNGEPQDGDACDLHALISKNCQVGVGLYERHRGSTDGEQPDDYIALAAASKMLRLPFAMDILRYGRRSTWHELRYNYPDKESSVRSWFGRFPHVIAHFEWCAGETPPLWRRLWWSVTIATAGLMNPRAQDPWVLSWFMIWALNNDLFFERWAVSFHNWRLKRAWPGGLSEVLMAYYQSHTHPTALYWKGDR